MVDQCFFKASITFKSVLSGGDENLIAALRRTVNGLEKDEGIWAVSVMSVASCMNNRESYVLRIHRA